MHFATLSNYSVNNLYTDDDYQIRSNGKRFLNPYDVNKPLMNITSNKSRDDMLNFIAKVVNHLKTFSKNVQNKIKLIVSTFSPDDATEILLLLMMNPQSQLKIGCLPVLPILKLMLL